MKKIFFVIYILVISFLSAAQSPSQQVSVLYGKIGKEQLAAAPFNKWFDTTYDVYKPDAATIDGIKKLVTKDISIQVFLGTWCGDSKREVPRFLKILDDVSFPNQRLQIIGVGGSDSLYKQSPSHEEEGKGIFRVPVFIIYKNGVEVDRINEYPALSLEKDFYAILANKPYTPNYRSFETLKNWLSGGVLLDENITARSLAWQLKQLVGSEGELTSIGRLWLRQGKQREALKISQVNASLYPESAAVMSNLGELYLRNSDTTSAVQCLEKALELNKDPVFVKSILRILYESKGLAAGK